MPPETEVSSANAGNIAYDTLSVLRDIGLGLTGYISVGNPLAGNWSSKKVTGGGPCQGTMATAYVMEDSKPTLVVRYQNCNPADRTPMAAVVAEIVKERTTSKQ